MGEKRKEKKKKKLPFPAHAPKKHSQIDTMAQSVERSCTFLVAAEALPTPAEIKAALEDGDDRSRAAAMRAAVSGVLNGGEPIPGLFITIVRYVLPSEDHTVQKLLLLYLVRSGRRRRDGKRRKKNENSMPLSRDGFFFVVVVVLDSFSLQLSSPPSLLVLPPRSHTLHLPFSPFVRLANRPAGNDRKDRRFWKASPGDGKRSFFSS